MDRVDAEARMANQLRPDERAKHADVLLDNDGSLADLESQVDRLWMDLRRRAETSDS
jgi:dephospho-CoA kinase